MDYYFITGSSKGLGKALTELLLEDGNNKVVGLARTQFTEHQNYTHTKIDLSKINVVESYTFPAIENADKIVLVNNAGMIGDVNHIGNIENQSIIDCYNLNLIAPAILTNNFIASYASFAGDKIVLNISSGAAKSPIDGWNVYCSSKAGLDMFSQVLNEEAKIDNSNITVFSLAPGIIDTDMQIQIREADQTSFSNIERFISYKKEGDLVSASITAKQVLRFIKEKELSTNVVCSVRDLTN